MKANHIPRADRLQRRIDNLYSKMDIMWIPYGRKNPYCYCRYCDRSQPECSNYGHYKGCEVAGIEKEIAYYAKLRDETTI